MHYCSYDCHMQDCQLSSEQQTDCTKAFNLLDKDKDGTISTSELGTAMRSTGLNPTEDELKKMIKSVDVDHNGTLSFSEFQTLMIREVKKPELDQLRKVFGSYDRNKDGTITVSEAKQGLKESGFADDKIEETIGQMFEETDIDKDGKLNFEG